MSADVVTAVRTWCEDPDSFDWACDLAELSDAADFLAIETLVEQCAMRIIDLMPRDRDTCAIRAILKRLTTPIKLKCLDVADKDWFLVLRDSINPYQKQYQQQLRSLLHESLFAQGVGPQAAFNAYEAVLRVQRSIRRHMDEELRDDTSKRSLGKLMVRFRVTPHHDHEAVAITRIGFSPNGRYLFVTNDDDGVAVCDLQDDRFSVRYRTGVIDAEFGDRNDLFTAEDNPLTAEEAQWNRWSLDGGMTLQRHQVMREPQALAMFGSLLLTRPYFLRPSHRFYRSAEPRNVKLVEQKLWSTETAALESGLEMTKGCDAFWVSRSGNAVVWLAENVVKVRVKDEETASSSTKILDRCCFSNPKWVSISERGDFMCEAESRYPRVHWFEDGFWQDLDPSDLGAISPDGRLIALVAHWGGSRCGISILRLAGKKFTRFVSIACEYQLPMLESVAWSPDGCFLAIGKSTEVIILDIERLVQDPNSAAAQSCGVWDFACRLSLESPVREDIGSSSKKFNDREAPWVDVSVHRGKKRRRSA